MNRLLTAAILSLVGAATTGALAQGVPYNRGLAPHSLRYDTVNSGGAASHEVSAELVMTSDGADGHDLGFSATVLVNGAIAVGPVFATAVANSNSQSWGCYAEYCQRVCAGGWCQNLSNFICICIHGPRDNATGTARFALPIPTLHEGDVVVMQLAALPGSAPELYTPDDQQVLIVTSNTCRADFNHDGAVNSQDFFDFITAFFALLPTADFNGNGAVNSQDFFDFVTAFFAGC